MTRFPHDKLFLHLFILLFSATHSGAGILTGTVREKETGLPLANVDILAFSLTGGAGSEVTDASGGYTMTDLPAGSYILYGRRAGYGTDFIESIELPSSGQTSASDLLLTNNPGTIQGSVSFDGAPLPGMIVEVLVRTTPNNAWSVQNFTTTRAQTGINYSLSDLSEGLSYDVRVLAPTVGPTRYASVARRRISATGGATTRVDFAMQKAVRIFGTVTDGNAPVPGIVMSLNDRDFNFSTVTDQSGNYELHGNPDMPLQLRTTPPDHTDYVLQIETLTGLASGDHRSDVILTSGALKVSGIVTTEATGSPVGGLPVSSWNSQAGSGANTSTAPDGSYTLSNLPPGPTQVRVRPNSGFAEDGIAFELSTNRSAVNFSLIPPALIEGTVRDRQTQDAIPGVQVVYFDNDIPIYLDTLTDGAGRFSFSTVREGQVTLRVEPDPDQSYDGRFYAGREIDLRISRGERVTGYPVMIEEGALLTGHLRDTKSNPVVGIWVDGKRRDGREFDWNRSDSNGRYALRLPRGRYSIGFDTDDPDWAILPTSLEIASATDHRTIDFTAYGKGDSAKLRGMVTNPDGHPIHPGTSMGLVGLPSLFAPVTLQNYQLLATTGFAQLPNFGDSYELGVPPDAAYSVAFFLQGESIVIRGIREANPTSGQPLVENLDFIYDAEGGTISGYVTYNGLLLPGAEVVLFNTSGSFGGFGGFAEVGPDGSYLFRHVPPDTYEVRALHPDFGYSPPITVSTLANGETREGVNPVIPPNVQTLQTAARTPGRFEVGFKGETGRDYLVQVSQDLENWATVTTLTGQGAVLTWLDLHATETGKFYRVIRKASE